MCLDLFNNCCPKFRSRFWGMPLGFYGSGYLGLIFLLPLFYLPFSWLLYFLNNSSLGPSKQIYGNNIRSPCFYDSVLWLGLRFSLVCISTTLSSTLSFFLLTVGVIVNSSRVTCVRFLCRVASFWPRGGLAYGVQDLSIHMMDLTNYILQ